MFSNGHELAIRARIAAIVGLYDKEDIDLAVKNYLLFCLKHKDQDMRRAASKIVDRDFPQYKGMLEKYLILL